MLRILVRYDIFLNSEVMFLGSKSSRGFAEFTLAYTGAVLHSEWGWDGVDFERVVARTRRCKGHENILGVGRKGGSGEIISSVPWIGLDGRIGPSL